MLLPGVRVRPVPRVPIASLPPPRAGLEVVEKLLPTNLTSTDTTERDAGMLRMELSRDQRCSVLGVPPVVGE